jgi:hypothetical protein
VDGAAVLDQALELGVLREKEAEHSGVGVGHDGGHAEAVASGAALGGDPALVRGEARLLRPDGLGAAEYMKKYNCF